MVGSPYQTSSDLAEDLLFIQELNPQMKIQRITPGSDDPVVDRLHPLFQIFSAFCGFRRSTENP